MTGQVIFLTDAEGMIDQGVAVTDRALSAKAWETACTAQGRIVGAVDRALFDAPADGDIPIVAHSGVGAPLRHHLPDVGINHAEGRPHGGGCRFTFAPDLTSTPTDWRAI
ncbi:MAG: hypothetical protein JJ938_01460 [Roseicyclus sp.]|nr:hypothetical protein [Roseicyclus sp.]MBO6623514.1 hypothetical protein [Roseicyclus sp.]MBO6923821.1 hypothetical protein [Roseicyclus sp.]